jgi:hypothetical protein
MFSRRAVVGYLLQVRHRGCFHIQTGPCKKQEAVSSERLVTQPTSIRYTAHKQGQNKAENITAMLMLRHNGLKGYAVGGAVLRHCATSLKVAGSIPDGVTGIFHWHYPSGRTMALRLTQPLTEMSTRNISWEGKAAGAYGWQTYHLHVPINLKFGSLKLLESYEPVQACNGLALPLPLP